MNAKQLETIVGLIAGLETTIMQVFNALHDEGIMPREKVIRRFEYSIANFPKEVAHRELILVVLRQVLMGLQETEKENMSSDKRAEQMRQLFRVIDGAPPDSD